MAVADLKNMVEKMFAEKEEMSNENCPNYLLITVTQKELKR
jgi:hypothetical protein